MGVDESRVSHCYPPGSRLQRGIGQRRVTWYGDGWNIHRLRLSPRKSIVILSKQRSKHESYLQVVCLAALRFPIINQRSPGATGVSPTG